MLIAQISDLHIKAFNEKAYGIVPTSENLSNCVQHINQLNPLPDVVLVTGDITGNALKSELLHAASILDELTIPFFVIPGNHDNPTDVFFVFGEEHCPSFENGYINYVLDDYPIRLIGLDSTAKALPGGEFCETRAAWLESQLEKNKDKPTILFLHHPPVDVGVLETHLDGFTGAELLAQVVQKYDNIERIICGHVHLNCHLFWHGTVISTAPSMGLKLVLDLSLEMESQFENDAPAYLLHYWTPQQNLITHSVSLHKTSKAYLFE